MERRVQGHGISLLEVNDHSQGRSLIARDFKKPPSPKAAGTVALCTRISGRFGSNWSSWGAASTITCTGLAAPFVIPPVHGHLMFSPPGGSHWPFQGQRSDAAFFLHFPTEIFFGKKLWQSQCSAWGETLYVVSCKQSHSTEGCYFHLWAIDFHNI